MRTRIWSRLTVRCGPHRDDELLLEQIDGDGSAGTPGTPAPDPRAQIHHHTLSGLALRSPE